MESESFDMGEYKVGLDKSIANVMPDSWYGHARIMLGESEFTGRKRRFAEKLTDKILEKFETTPETAAKKAIQRTRERYD